MGSFDGAQVQAPDSLVFGVVLRLERLFRQRIGAHGARGDDLGRVHVIFHQHGRNGQHVGDVVEAIAGIVGRKVFFGAEIHGQQIANGVRIFAAVEAARRHVPGVRFDIAVGLFEFTFHVVDQGLHLRFGRAWNAFGRHLATAQLVENRFPAVAISRDRILRH